MRHLLEVDDLSDAELREVLALARQAAPARVLDGQGVALVFEKPSARTRNSMEMAVVQLGGHPITIRPDEVGLGSRETVEDVVRTLACYHRVVAARVFEHATLERMVSVSPVPVVNLLSDQAHPMQALADVLTIQEVFGSVEGRTVAYVGDGNNVCRSLGLAVVALGGRMTVASPEGYELGEGDVERIARRGAAPLLTRDPYEAVAGADVVYTDVWTSMGQEAETVERLERFAGFTVDEAMLEAAGPDAVLLHCLPAHRGEEVTDAALEGPRSRVWAQAANRMHAARGLLAWLVGRG